MGGEVCVGVRDRKGVEHIALRWTNEMPRVLMDSDFYLKPKTLQKFLDEAKPGQKWPEAKKVKTVSTSEYGVILIDFPNKRIFSRQGYTEVGKLIVWTSQNMGEECSAVTNLSKLGWVQSILREDERMNAHELNTKERAKFLAACKAYPKYRDFGPYRMILTNFSPPGWEIDHKSQSARDCWPLIVEWLASNKWKSKPKREREYMQVFASIGKVMVGP
jgi:hypothetical protein